MAERKSWFRLLAVQITPIPKAFSASRSVDLGLPETEVIAHMSSSLEPMTLTTCDGRGRLLPKHRLFLTIIIVIVLNPRKTPDTDAFIVPI